jgi:hypothetical protein
MPKDTMVKTCLDSLPTFILPHPALPLKPPSQSLSSALGR